MKGEGRLAFPLEVPFQTDDPAADDEIVGDHFGWNEFKQLYMKCFCIWSL